MTATRRARTPKPKVATTGQVAAPAAELKRLQRQAEREQLEAEFYAQVRYARLPLPRCKWYGGQLHWHPAYDYAADFAWLGVQLMVELDGGTNGRRNPQTGAWERGKPGGHTTGAGYHHDRVRDAEAAVAGWLVLRLDPEMVHSGAGLAYVERILAHRRAA